MAVKKNDHRYEELYAELEKAGWQEERCNEEPEKGIL